MSRYTKTMSEVLAEMSEGFSKKEIKMAIGVASDPRYKGGNYTGAFKAIEKIKKGLASHPQVAAVLKRQNEDIQESGHDDVASAKNQVKVAMSALQKMETELGKLKDEDSLPTWWTNKVAVSVDKLDGMADYLDTQVEEVELDEKREPFAVIDTADGDKVVGTASDEKGAKSIITSAELPPMKIKDKKTLKIVKVKKKQDIGYPLKEEDELDEGKMKGLATMAQELDIDSKDVDKLKQLMVIYTRAMKLPSGSPKADAFKREIAKLRKDLNMESIEVEDLDAVVVESWELDEMKMDDPKLLKIFDKLKKGSTVKIKIDSSISKGKDYREFTVTAKNIVGKGKKYEQEKITLKAKDNPTGVKHFLYNRDGKVTLAIGDMGASIADIKENEMSAYTAAITKGVK